MVEKIMEMMERIPWLTASIAKYSIANGLDIEALAKLEENR